MRRSKDAQVGNLCHGNLDPIPQGAWLVSCVALVRAPRSFLVTAKRRWVGGWASRRLHNFEQQCQHVTAEWRGCARCRRVRSLRWACVRVSRSHERFGFFAKWRGFVPSSRFGAVDAPKNLPPTPSWKEGEEEKTLTCREARHPLPEDWERREDPPRRGGPPRRKKSRPLARASCGACFWADLVSVAHIGCMLHRHSEPLSREPLSPLPWVRSCWPTHRFGVLLGSRGNRRVRPARVRCPAREAR